MSRETVRSFIKRFGDSINKDESNSRFPLKSMFLKIKDDLEIIPLNDQDEVDVVRESIYDLEDLLAQCQALSKKRSVRIRSFKKCYSPVDCFYLNKTKIKLRKIKNVLQSLQKEKAAPPENEKETGVQLEEPVEYQWSYGSVDISKIYGWEDEVNTINQKILQEGHDGLNTVAIVGNFGTGKTALAQKVFMSEDVKDSFCLRLWVCVSPECERKELVWRMLDNLGVEDIESILAEKGDRDELGILLFMLHLQLLDKRYLIVFDDIWEADDWHTNLDEQPPYNKEWIDRLAYGLPKGNGSAIIVTSRAHEVARRMVGRMNIVHPKRILDENAWLLFRGAYEEVQTPFDESLEGMKDKIIAKCDGLPLALKTVGKELAQQFADSSKLGVDDSNSVKPEDEDTNKTQTDDLAIPKVNDTSKPEAVDNAKPEPNEKGEFQGGDASKLFGDTKKQDADATKYTQQSESIGEKKPGDDHTNKSDGDKMLTSMQLEDPSTQAKITSSEKSYSGEGNMQHGTCTPQIT